MNEITAGFYCDQAGAVFWTKGVPYINGFTENTDIEVLYASKEYGVLEKHIPSAHFKPANKAEIRKFHCRSKRWWNNIAKKEDAAKEIHIIIK